MKKQPKDGAAPKAKAKAKPKRKPSALKITKRQSLFCREYLIDLNATQAAIRAGYSKNAAAEVGYENLRKPHIAAYIAEVMEKRAQRLDVDADYVLKRLVSEVGADMADLYDDNNKLLPIKQWPLIWRQGLVAGMEVDEIFAGSGENRESVGYTTKIKLSDRAQRLVSIGKHISVQAFKEAMEVTVSPEYAARLDAAIARGARYAAERKTGA